jgi:hypothetical protein
MESLLILELGSCIVSRVRATVERLVLRVARAVSWIMLLLSVLRSAVVLRLLLSCRSLKGGQRSRVLCRGFRPATLPGSPSGLLPGGAGIALLPRGIPRL